ncbi:MAG: hypothetical protein AB9891_02140 [Anaerolineaceae bacterium]
MLILKTQFLKFLVLLLAILSTGCALAPAPQTTAPPAQDEVPAFSPDTESGLWLVLQNEKVVEVIQPGSKKTITLVEGISGSEPAVLFALQKSTGAKDWFALLDGQTLTLRFHQMPDWSPKKEVPLLSNPEISEEKSAVYQQVLTSPDPPAVVWSPDGNQAVFLAAIDHPCLELYLFDSSDLSVTRLSEASRDVYQPTWSPDGQWVVYDETDGLNMIGLWAVTAVKAVRDNASQTVTLYEPQSYAEPVIGWSSPTTFIVHSVRERGPVDLREVSLEGGQASLIFAGVFTFPNFDPKINLTAFLITDAFSDPAMQPVGIYTGSKTQPAKLLAAGTWSTFARESNPGLYLAVKDPSGAVSISPSGQQVSFDDESSLPVISPQGDILAFTGAEGSSRPGLRLYSLQGELEAEVTSDPVDDFMWLPDGSLVFSQGGGLYQLTSPSGQPTKLAENADLLGWLNAGTIP